MTDVQVKTELKLDSNAQAMMDEIRQDFEELNEQVMESKDAVRNFGTQFTATFAALNLGPLLEGMADAAASFISVGSAAYDTEQGIAGMLAGMTGNEWGEARAYAEDLNAEFNDLSINIGQAKEDIIAGQQTLTTFLGGTSQAFEVANKNMSNLTTIANVQGIAVQELGGQFGKMAAGFVSMESPVFNLLRSTGIFSNDITKVNAEWQKLTQEERINRLEGAFESIADNLADAPPTLTDMLTSVKAIGSEFMETFGKSAMGEFMDEMDMLRGDLKGARGDFTAIGTELGADAGKLLADVFVLMQKAVAFIHENSAEIRDYIKDGFQYARDTIDWIVGHKEELMAIGGAFALSQTGIGGGLLKGAAGAAATAAGGVAGRMGTGTIMRSGVGDKAMAEAVSRMQTQSGRFAKTMGSFVATGGTATQMGARLATGMGGLFSAIAAGGPPVWAATAAVGALAAGAVYLTHKLNEAHDERSAVIDKNLKEYTELTQKMDALTEAELKRMDTLRAEAEKLAAENDVRVSDDFEKAWADREEKILKMYVHPMQKIDEAVQRYAAQAEEEGLFPEEMGAQRMAVNAAARLYTTAWQTHNEGAMKYIANMLGQSKAMREAFLTSADMTAEGFQSLAKTVRELGADFSEEFGGQLSNIAKAEMELKAKNAAPQVNFNGGQVFKIQQDFRDQDPDRVVVSFEKRFTQAAVSRVQATTSTPFGT